jgi:hypothetical protein
MVTLMMERYYKYKFKFFKPFHYNSAIQLPFENLLVGCPKLEQLQLQGVPFSPENVKSLCELLAHRTCRLKSLGLIGEEDRNIVENTIELLLGSTPVSLKVLFWNF